MLAVKRIAAGLLVLIAAGLGYEIDQVTAGTDISVVRRSTVLTGMSYGTLPPDLRPPAAPVNYDVFHSIAVPVDALPAFAEAARFSPAAPGGRAGTCVDRFCDTRAGRRLAMTAVVAARLPALAALRFVNSQVNRAIRYEADAGDHWASLSETAARGVGDCEDYAIAKWELLRSVGFAPEQLQFIVVKDMRKQLYHAVLAVHLGGQRFILDNMSNAVARDEIFRSYVPIVSFAGGKSFIHGMNAAVARRAASGDIRPGGGN